MAALVFTWRAPGRALINAGAGVGVRPRAALANWPENLGLERLPLHLRSQRRPGAANPRSVITLRVSTLRPILHCLQPMAPLDFGSGDLGDSICGTYILGCILLALSIESRSNIVRARPALECAFLLFWPELTWSFASLYCTHRYRCGSRAAGPRYACRGDTWPCDQPEAPAGPCSSVFFVRKRD
jgi:hypothetical protein